jgi:hypothetical protein
MGYSIHLCSTNETEVVRGIRKPNLAEAKEAIEMRRWRRIERLNQVAIRRKRQTTSCSNQPIPNSLCRSRGGDYLCWYPVLLQAAVVGIR